MTPPVAHAAGAHDEAGLRACLRANLERQSLVQDLTIEQTDAGGAMRRLVGRWWWTRDGSRSRGAMKLTAPPDLAGAAYLMLRDGKDQKLWMYLPAIGKPREVGGAAVAQSLFGSGLSAFDLGFLVDGLSGGTLTPLGATTWGGRSAERWRFIPRPDPNGLYDRADLTIDSEWCLPMESQLFGGVPWKTLSLDASTVRQIDGRWFAPRATLVDLRAGTRAVITLRDVDGAAVPGERSFRPDQFYRTR